MESVSEFPGNLHFFKLLSLLSRHNHVSLTQVMLKVPPTLILGFGFEKPTYMASTLVGVRFESVLESELSKKLDALNLYSDRDRLSLPRFLIKTETEKWPCRTTHEVLHKLSSRRGENCVVQPFILSPDYTAQRVRVTWSQDTGVTAVLFANEVNYFRKRRGAGKTHRKLASAGDGIESTWGVGVEDQQLFVSPFVEPSACSLSKSTSFLSSAVTYTKVLLEKSVLVSVSGVITSLTVEVMLDLVGKW